MSFKYKVGVIGLGYVGLPLLLHFAQEGVKVIGFDIDDRKVQMLNNGQSYIEDVPSENLSSVKEFYQATTDMSKISETENVIIAVPTPLDEYREPDLKYVRMTAETISKYLVRGQTISLESTTYPGTTREVLQPILEKSGMKVEEDFFLVYSPERVDPGNKKWNIKNTPKLVGGIGEKSLQKGISLYSIIVDNVVPVSSPEVAELAKILENTYRAVNIALVNELKMLCHRMGIDIWEVIDAAATKPFGFQPFYPGPGIGGHCIPIDPFYLTWKAKEYDFHTRFIELAGEINENMPYWTVGKVMEALNDRQKSLKGSRILVVGVAYKPDVGDLRESPALKVLYLLMKSGAEVEYTDKYVPVIPQTRKWGHTFDSLHSVKLTPENVKSYDVVLILTNHSYVDYSCLRQNAQLIVDTRGVYKENYENVVKA